jgi:uncharacterized protein
MTSTWAGHAFTFQAYGHPNITATHPTTLEITREPQLTSRGDCIVGVRATCGASGLPANLKDVLSSNLGKATLKITVEGETFVVLGRGSSALTLQHTQEMVFRKSSFASDRTVFVKADKAAMNIPRTMVRLLRNPEQQLEIEIRAF